MKALSKKAYHFSQITILRQYNLREENNRLVEIVFNSIKLNVDLTVHERILKNTLRKKYGKGFIKGLLPKVSTNDSVTKMDLFNKKSNL